MEPVYRTVEVISRVLFRLQGLRFTMTGVERIPRTGGAVIAINHTAYVDPLYSGFAVRKAHRWLRFMAKVEVFEHPVTGPIVRGAKQIPVDRFHGGDALPATVRALRAGELVGVYPEATISRSFELKEFKTGAARLALEAQVPIIPMVVWGAQRVWTKGGPRNLGRTRTPIHVAVGEPLVPVGEPHELTDRLKAQMGEMLRRVQDEYGPHPAGEYWVPKRLGGGAPTLAEADAMDAEYVEARRRDRAAREHGPGEQQTRQQDRDAGSH